MKDGSGRCQVFFVSVGWGVRGWVGGYERRWGGTGTGARVLGGSGAYVSGLGLVTVELGGRGEGSGEVAGARTYVVVDGSEDLLRGDE